MYSCSLVRYFFFFFNDTATTEIYTLSLHDALPISRTGAAWASLPPHRHSGSRSGRGCGERQSLLPEQSSRRGSAGRDRKSTRLNSSHANISYAVFCLKKKKKQ